MGGRVGSGAGLGGQAGCERRIEVVEIQKTFFFWEEGESGQGGGGGQGGCEHRIEVLVKIQKKNGGGVVSGGGGVGLGGGGGQGRCEYVNGKVKFL